MKHSPPPKLVALYLEQFRMFQNLTLEFVPGLNIFAGENAIGKTSALLALDMLRSLALNKIESFFMKHNLISDQLKYRDRPLLKLGVLLECYPNFCLWRIHWNAVGEYLEYEELYWGPSPEALAKLWVFREGLLTIHDKGGEERREYGGVFFRSSMIDGAMVDGTSLNVKRRILDWALGVTSFDILDLDLLAQGTVTGDYPAPGFRGVNHTGFLAGLRPRRRRELESRMRTYNRFFKNLKCIKISGNRTTALFRDARPGSPLRSLDMAGGGQRRLLFLAGVPELPAWTSLVMLEEVENGIYFHALPMVLADLDATPFQIILTSYTQALIDTGKHVIFFHDDAPDQGRKPTRR